MKKNYFVFGLFIVLFSGNGLVAMNQDRFGGVFANNDWQLQLALAMSSQQKADRERYEQDLDMAKRRSQESYDEEYLGKKKQEIVIPAKGLENSGSCLCCGYTSDEHFEEKKQKMLWVKLGCGHVMCNDCLSEWKKKSTFNTCPFCKKTIDPGAVNMYYEGEEKQESKKAKKKKTKKRRRKDKDESVNIMARGLRKMLGDK